MAWYSIVYSKSSYPKDPSIKKTFGQYIIFWPNGHRKSVRSAHYLGIKLAWEI